MSSEKVVNDSEKKAKPFPVKKVTKAKSTTEANTDDNVIDFGKKYKGKTYKEAKQDKRFVSLMKRSKFMSPGISAFNSYCESGLELEVA